MCHRFLPIDRYNRNQSNHIYRFLLIEYSGLRAYISGIKSSITIKISGEVDDITLTWRRVWEVTWPNYDVMFAIEFFWLTLPAYIQIYWNKRKRLHKKRVQLPEDWFGTPTQNLQATFKTKIASLFVKAYPFTSYKACQHTAFPISFPMIWHTASTDVSRA